jgi:hypothetical protein
MNFRSSYFSEQVVVHFVAMREDFEFSAEFLPK